MEALYNKKILVEKVKYGDYLIYADSGSYYLGDTKIFVDLMKKYNLDILPFALHFQEKKWTKRDAFILMECDSPEYTNTPQIHATFAVFKKTNFTLAFLNEWLKYAQDRRIITNDPNKMGKNNYKGFRENRHDQTIFSLLVKKHKLKYFRDPINFWFDVPLNIKENSRKQKYPPMMKCHRSNKDCPYFGFDFCDI